MEGSALVPRSRGFYFVWIALAAAVILWPCSGDAKFYRFVDEDGRIHFVDDISKVPDRFLPELDEYRERYDHLPAEERAARIKEDRRLAERLEAQRQAEEAESERRRREATAEAARQAAQKTEDALRRQQETKVVVTGQQILVPVRLGYDGREIEALLLLDTGASNIVLHREVADRLKLQPIGEGSAQLVGGQSIRTEAARLSTVSVGPIRDTDTLVLVIDHEGQPVPFDGLLGMNFLRKVTYSVDYENQVIRWQP
jgi:predicted aspartyl protease